MTGAPLSFWWVFPLCLALAAASLQQLADRATGDRRLRAILLASFWVRLGLGILLYAISRYQWPVLRSLQLGDGFWSFAPDAHVHHMGGVQLAEAWAAEMEPPYVSMSSDYFVVLAALHWLLGPHPLYAVLLHGWLGALSGWLAYRIGEQLFDRRSALRAALFVGLWPSSVLWSTQVLKDALAWVLVLAILWLVARMVAPRAAAPERGLARPWRWAAHAAALVAMTLVLTRLRVYLGSVLSLVALVTLAPAGCAALFSRRVRGAMRRAASAIAYALRRCAGVMRGDVGRAAGLCSVAAMVIGAVIVARDLDTKRLFWPAHPERGHVRLGLRHQQRGEWALAEAEFKRAIDLRPEDRETYLLWAGLLSAAHRPREALAVCASWLGADTDGRMNRCVNQLSDALRITASPPVAPEAASVPPSLKERAASDAPTGLEARPFSGTQISLSWSPGAGDMAVTGYRIFRDGIPIGTTPGLSYEDTGLTPSTSYTYAVDAFDAAGQVSASAPAVRAATLPPTPPPLSTGLLAHWSFDEGAGVIAAGASSDQHPDGRLRRGPRWIQGVLGKALSFDGENDYVDAGPIPPLTVNFTIAGWVNLRNDPPLRAQAMWCSQGLNGQHGWAVYLYESGGQIFHGFLKGGVALVTNGVPSAGGWEHVAWVVDEHARPALYLDGTLVSQGKHDDPINPPIPGIATYLGADQTPAKRTDHWFPGALDDVRLYRRALISAEIAALARTSDPGARGPRRTWKPPAMWKGIPPRDPASLVAVQDMPVLPARIAVKTPPDAQTPLSPPTVAAPINLQARALSDTQIALSWAPGRYAAAVAGNRIFRDGVLIGTSLGLSYEDIGLAPRTAYRYAIVAVDPEGYVSAKTPLVTATTRPPGPAPDPALPPTGLLAHWSFDEGAGLVAAEASVQQLHARLRNGPRWIQGVLGNALRFDGVDDSLDAGSLPPLNVNFTVAGWVHRHGRLQDGAYAMWCSQGVSGMNGWAVYLYKSGGRIVHSFLKGGVAGVTSDVPSADGWEHVAWVVDEHARPTLYLDGTPVFHAPQLDLPIHPPVPGIAAYLGAGQNSTGKPDNFFPGALDDVRLYRRALTASAIAELARQGGRARRRIAPPPTPAVMEAPIAPPPTPAVMEAPIAPPPTPAVMEAPIAPPPTPAVNRPPTVQVGPNQTLRRPETIVLNGQVSDDGRPSNTLTYWWNQILGPPAYLLTPAAAETKARLPERGRYQFRLSVSDGGLDAFGDVAVTVEALTIGATVAHLGEQGLEMLDELTLHWIAGLRNSVLFGGGSSLMDVQSDISQPLEMVGYLPRAILVAFLAPFPWQWFDTGGSTGGMRLFAGAEAFLMHLLLAGLAIRGWRTTRLLGWRECARRTIRRAQLGEWFILAFGLSLGVASGLVIANLGMLFRIRLLYWLPLLILVAAGQCSIAWHRRQFIRGRDRWRAWPRDEDMTPTPQPPAAASPETVGVLAEEA